MKLSEFEMLLTEQVRTKFDRSVNKADVSATLKALAVTLYDHLKQGDSIQLPGIGTFKVVERAARTGRNPRTGEPINIRPQAGEVHGQQEPSGSTERLIPSL